MNQAVQFDFAEDEMSLKDYVDVARRRKWPMLLTMCVVAACTLLAAILLPAKYTSQATIQIEEQDLPREFVTSTITSYAAQQIQVISQRLLTAESIASISDKFGLFRDPDTGQRPPATVIAEQFRDQLELDLLSADVIDPRSGRPQEATIAFTLAFEHSNPRTAQNVTNELVTLFLNESLRTRTERAENTEAFLSSQAASLSEELKQMEQAIADFKRINGAALPELYQYNLSSLERRSSELSEVDRRLRELSARKVELVGEMNLRNPNGGLVGSDGRALMSNTDQLTALRTELSQKSTVYHDNHPDIRNLRRQISELENATVVEAEDSLTTSTNPAFILLETQLGAVDAEINGFETKRAELRDRVSYFESLLSRAPTVEQDYNSLIRDYQTAQARYQDVKGQERAAEISENMESERRGERFTMIEAPSLPVEPTSPNRPAIVLIGLVLAFGAGAGLAFLMEAFDSSIHAEQALTRIMGAPPFATVGYITTQAEKNTTRKLRLLFVGAAGVALLTFLVLVHFLIRPLDIVWFQFLGMF